MGDGSVRLGVDAIGGVATATLVQALSREACLWPTLPRGNRCRLTLCN